MGAQKYDNCEVVRLFSEQPTFEITGEKARFKGRPQPTAESNPSSSNGNAQNGSMSFYEPRIQWNQIADKYGLPGWFDDWEDRAAYSMWEVINLTNLAIVKAGGQIVQGNTITSYDAMAAYLNIIPKDAVYPLKGTAVLVTEDDKVILGRRSDIVSHRRVTGIPVGRYKTLSTSVVPVQESYNTDPVSDALETRFRDEFRAEELTPQGLIGIIESLGPNTKGTRFVALFRAHTTFEDIRNKHRDIALTRRLLTVMAEGNKSQAIREMKEFYPREAHNYKKLRSIDNDPDAIREWVTRNHKVLSGMGAGTLLLYADHLEAA
ncbi:hypothetical protein GOV09_07170 [Candidatus Woesearchaeota archaeon]|nr:hypothetical protein [Candidatus Woesearchaeota archaeon]